MTSAPRASVCGGVTCDDDVDVKPVGSLTPSTFYSVRVPTRPHSCSCPSGNMAARFLKGAAKVTGACTTPAGQPNEKTFDTTGVLGPGSTGAHSPTLTLHAVPFPLARHAPRAAASAATVAAASASGATYKYQTDAGFRREATFWMRVGPIIGHYAWTKREFTVSACLPLQLWRS